MHPFFRDKVTSTKPEVETPLRRFFYAYYVRLYVDDVDGSFLWREEGETPGIHPSNLYAQCLVSMLMYIQRT
jgi:hypothetical protein